MIEFRNVTVVQKKRKLFDRMCFKLNNGKVYGILGETDTVCAIAELLAGVQTPAEGMVLINGFDLFREASRAKALLGYVPSSPALYNHMTPVEYLLFLADVRQIDYEKSIRLIGELLSLAGLSHKRNRLIGSLSAYEKKCLTLSQALLYGAEILILNDPFGTLEGQDAERFSDLIEDLSQERTLIICTPVTKYLRKICNTVYTVEENSLSAKDQQAEEGIH